MGLLVNGYIVDRPGILATVGHTFHEQGINISEATCRASDDGRAMNTFTFLCSDLAQLKNVIRQLQRIPGGVDGAHQSAPPCRRSIGQLG